MKYMHKLRSRKSNKRNQNIAVICIALMFIAIGFALISTTLSITSNSTIGKVTFDVHFENLKIKEGSMTAKIPANINAGDKTKISFSLDLKDPGSYYEFTADIVNKGTLDAKVNLVKIDGLTDEQRKYIKVSYKYIYGTEILINDLFKSGEKEGVKVRVEFLKDINGADLPSTDEPLNLTFETEFIQDDGTGNDRDKSEIKVNILGQDMTAYMDNVESKYVSSETGVNFGKAPSDTNGKGLYLRTGTEEDEYPIYYYRGDVDNNHVLFGGFCWKIVRTTETGGIKIIYDGDSNNGQCNNSGETSKIGNSVFNENSDSLADIGYMYGTRYRYAYLQDKAYIYGSDVTYSNGVYTLTDISASDTISNIKTKHYTCRSATSVTCSTVYYAYSFYNGTGYAIKLVEGKKLESFINEAFANENDSTIKATIDTWFASNLVSLEDKLEDAVWCNDRSISSGGYLKDGDVTADSNGITYLSVYDRNHVLYSPAVKDAEACSNKNDRFTKSDIIKGNGALTYPVGLITADEVTLAGNIKESFLSSGDSYWTMSSRAVALLGCISSGFSVYNTGDLGYSSVSSDNGVRPAIVLKKGIVSTSGNGSSEHPYVVE